MLRNEVARYTELSGNDGLHTPIGIIGAYLDGYEKGRADAQPKLDENTLSEQQESDKLGVKTGETCTDCISRQAAIDLIKSWSGGYDYIETPTDAAVRSFEQLPSAQRKGKWIYLNGLDAFECSVCGRQMVRNIFDYCPWCGADMRGERDG